MLKSFHTSLQQHGGCVVSLNVGALRASVAPEPYALLVSFLPQSASNFCNILTPKNHEIFIHSTVITKHEFDAW